jgi:hypothetical protein
MGSLRLKKKVELNYGKRSTSQECSYCNYFVAEFQAMGIGGEPRGIEPRCMIMGLNMSSRYRINPRLHCDAYDGSDYLRKLKGE